MALFQPLLERIQPTNICRGGVSATKLQHFAASQSEAFLLQHIRKVLAA